MSILLEKMQKDVKALRESYENFSWFQRLFFPRGLGKALLELRNGEPYTLLHLYQTYFSNAWFFQRWSFSALRLFSASLATQIIQSGYQKVNNLDELENTHWNTLNVNYCFRRLGGPGSALGLEEFPQDSLSFALYKIQEADLLTETNINGMGYCPGIGHYGLDNFAIYFVDIYRNYTPALLLPTSSTPTAETPKKIHAPDPITKKNMQTLITTINKARKNAVEAFKILHENDLLTGEQAQAIFDIVTSDESPNVAAEHFKDLKECGLLEGARGQTILQLIETEKDLEGIALALCNLQKCGLLDSRFAKACFDAVAKPRTYSCPHQSPYDVAFSLARLQEKGLLDGAHAQENFDAVMMHEKPSYLCNAIKSLWSYDSLGGAHAQANFDALINHKDPKNVTDALETLHRIRLLKGASAQKNFETMVANRTDPFNMALMLRRLHEIGLLTGVQAQTNISNIVQYYDLLVTDCNDSELWEEIPSQKMTQQYLDQLIAICKQSELPEHERHDQVVRSWIKTAPEAFAYAEMEERTYSNYTTPFIASTLENLHQRAENTPSNTVFDLNNDDECKFCFYIIRNLIRQNSPEVQDEISFLVSIPAVRALVATAITYNETNELLRLALYMGNQDAASLLLEIPEVKKIAEQHNYYPGMLSYHEHTPTLKKPTSASTPSSKISFFSTDDQAESSKDSGLLNPHLPASFH
jgi:hypothetical protein